MINFFKQKENKKEKDQLVKPLSISDGSVIEYVCLSYNLRTEWALIPSYLLSTEHNVFLCVAMFLSGRTDPVWEVGQTERAKGRTRYLCICPKNGAL